MADRSTVASTHERGSAATRSELLVSGAALALSLAILVQLWLAASPPADMPVDPSEAKQSRPSVPKSAPDHVGSDAARQAAPVAVRLPPPPAPVPVESVPVESVPVESGPVEPGPVESAPVEPGPTEPAPTEPAPTKTKTAEPDPAALETPIVDRPTPESVPAPDPAMSVGAADPEPPASMPEPRRVLRPRAAPRTSSAPALLEGFTPLTPSPAPPAPETEPRRATEPEPEAASAPREVAGPSPTATVPAGTSLARGRVALRRLEHGHGPLIEIGWPDDRAARARLYRVLTRCHGMRTALMAPGGTLFVDEGARGQVWTPNLDRISGFARRPAGVLPRAETRVLQAIRTRHGGLRGAVVVRVFDRAADASLLAGLGTLVGPGYDGAGRIRAAYGFDGGRVVVGGIMVDGRPIDGRFMLKGRRSCG